MAKASKSGQAKHTKVPLHTVMAVMKTIHKKGKSRHFMVSAHKAGAFISVSAKTMKFVQKYAQENNLAAHAATKVVTARCPQPYKCPNVAP
jgi:hypothetical protein